MRNETDNEKEQQQVSPKDPVASGDNQVAPPEPPKPEKPIIGKETEEDHPEELQASQPNSGSSNSDQVTLPKPPTNERNVLNKDQRNGFFSRDAKKLASLAENIDSTIKNIINSLPGFRRDQNK